MPPSVYLDQKVFDRLQKSEKGNVDLLGLLAYRHYMLDRKEQYNKLARQYKGLPERKLMKLIEHWAKDNLSNEITDSYLQRLKVIAKNEIPSLINLIKADFGEQYQELLIEELKKSLNASTTQINDSLNDAFKREIAALAKEIELKTVAHTQELQKHSTVIKNETSLKKEIISNLVTAITTPVILFSFFFIVVLVGKLVLHINLFKSLIEALITLLTDIKDL